MDGGPLCVKNESMPLAIPMLVRRKRERKQRHKTRTGLQEGGTNDIQFVPLDLSKTMDEKGDCPESQPNTKLKKRHLKLRAAAASSVATMEKYKDYILTLSPEKTGSDGSFDKLSDDGLQQDSIFSSGRPSPGHHVLPEELVGNELDNYDWDDTKTMLQTKMHNTSEIFLTKIEEEHILERAEIYAVMILPEEQYYILPPPNPGMAGGSADGYIGGYHGMSGSSGQRKRKRRSYNNVECFVTYRYGFEHINSPQKLPEGTRLLKPQNKLVELVAHAIDKSPDGLLQVQQIYAVLQNKYPYFKYMDKAYASSWRSSIRHALYQKWFRKIRFRTESINTKGCFWTINRSFNPKEWIMPGGELEDEVSMPDDGSSLDLDLDFDITDSNESFAAVASILNETTDLPEENSTEEQLLQSQGVESDPMFNRMERDPIIIDLPGDYLSQEAMPLFDITHNQLSAQGIDDGTLQPLNCVNDMYYEAASWVPACESWEGCCECECQSHMEQAMQDNTYYCDYSLPGYSVCMEPIDHMNSGMVTPYGYTVQPMIDDMAPMQTW